MTRWRTMDIRAFPRRTKATPDDDMVRIGLPSMFDEAERVEISVAFEWDKPVAERMERAWRHVAPTTVGGPAYGDPGGNFEPGRYLRRGYTITSRGCPNRCWFCRAWQNEGTIRELPICDGYNVLDNNLLACSESHIRAVFAMLARQSERPRLTGGLEAARLLDWHVEWLARLKPKVIWMAYDTPDDWEPLVVAASRLKDAGLITGQHCVRCYVLAGWPDNTLSAADARCVAVARLGVMPMAMLLDNGLHTARGAAEWREWRRTWARPVIAGAKMREATGSLGVHLP